MAIDRNEFLNDYHPYGTPLEMEIKRGRELLKSCQHVTIDIEGRCLKCRKVLTEQERWDGFGN